MFCFCTIFCDTCVFYDVWAFASQILWKGDKKSFQFFNQLLKSVLHEKLNDWKMTSKKLCIFLFLHDLICVFSQCPPHACNVLYLGKWQHCWWFGSRVLSLRAPWFEWNASASSTLRWRDKVAGSIDRSIRPPTLHPHFLGEDREQSVFCKIDA